MTAIARALGTGCALLVTDEPTAALGMRETAEVTELVLRLEDRDRPSSW